MSSIRFDRVWKFFEGNAVVSDLNLEIIDGEFLVLVGPSGCGKTTSLRMLAGLERPSHGRIWMEDVDVTDLAAGQRDVAMVFQSYALYPNMTVYRNLAFGPRVRKEPRENLDARIGEVADLLGIRHLLQRSPAALSGGQRQRVALGRALIREPRVFLMDEPLSNLDAALRVQMRAELIRLHTRLEHTTTVYVTHDQVEALTMGDRVAVLKDGVLLQVDRPNDLFENPNTAFVGEFIGSPKMNQLPGVLSWEEGHAVVECLGVKVRLSDELSARVVRDAAGPVVVGIRPHDFGTARVEDQPDARVDGLVDVCEHTGTELFATVDVGERKVIARLPRSPVPEAGSRVTLQLPSSHFYLFDVDSNVSLLARSNAEEPVGTKSGIGGAS